MKKFLLNLTVLVACLLCSISAVAAEAYTHYVPALKTLTFYYDNQRSFRIGTTYDLNTGDALPGWYNDGTYADVTTVVFDTSFSDARPKSTHAWFRGMTKLTTITDIENLNTSKVTDMGLMFQSCTYLTRIDVSYFNTINVTDMRSMFYGCYCLTRLDVSKFNTSNVTNMMGMFVDCAYLSSLDVSNFNTAKVTNMGSMFSGCVRLTSLDLTNFNTAKVTNMGSMFSHSNALTTIYVGSHWTTSNVTQSSDMFWGCTSLVGEQGTAYNSSFTTAAYAHIDGGTSNPGYLSTGTEAYACYSPTNTMLTFYYDKLRSTRTGTTYDMPRFDENIIDFPGWYDDSTCHSVTRVVFNSSFANARPETTHYWFTDMENLQMITGMKNYLNTSKVKSLVCMFQNCKKLTSIDVSGFNTDNTLYMGGLFWGCSSLTSINVSNFNTDNVYDMSAMFADCENLTSLDLSNFNTDNVESMYAMFANCENLTSLDLSNFNTHYVTNMYGMFWNCQNLTSLDVSNFNTTNVTEMYYMFGNCCSLTSLDVSHFNTDKVTSMCGMFGGCYSLTSLDVTSFNTANVTNMYQMFYGCSGLTRLDLSSFNTAKVTDMRYMFVYCRNLVSIYVDDGWNTEAVAYSEQMFYECTNIRGDMGTTYDDAHVDKAYAHLDGGTANPGYLSMKPEFTRGDVDGDGHVKISDVTALINYLLSGDASAVNLDAADCDLDGNIKIGDVTALINYLLSGSWANKAMAPAMNNARPQVMLLDRPMKLKEIKGIRL